MATPINYGSLLAADPVLQAALGHVNTAAAAGKTALTAARQQALVQYGAVPTAADTSLVGDIAPDITPGVAQEAQQATQAGLSDVGQAERAYNVANESSVANLAARGMLHSGALRQHQLQNLTGLQTGLAGAQEGALGKLAQAWQGYTGQQETLAGQAQSATESAAGRLENAIGQGLYDSPPATPKPPGSNPKPGATRFQNLRNTVGYPSARPSLGASLAKQPLR